MMNKRIENLMYHAGLTAQGCWDSMDEYDKAAIEKFAELIVRECADLCERIAKVHLEEENPIAYVYGSRQCRDTIKQYFGVEE